MPGPVTHIALTEKIFDRCFSGKVRKDFYIGTLFPDIRYLGFIDRSMTHYTDLTMAGIQSEDSFLAGLKFHSLVDITWRKYHPGNGLYASYSIPPNAGFVVKMAEDSFFYNYVDDWQAIIKFLDDILQHEKAFGMPVYILRTWHTLLQQYFKKQPGSSVIKSIAGGAGISKDLVEQTENLLPAMQKDQKVSKTLQNLFEKTVNLMLE